MWERYIIGTNPAPWWCEKRLAPYMKADGSTGWEYYGRWRTYELKAGDELIFDGFKIIVGRR